MGGRLFLHSRPSHIIRDVQAEDAGECRLAATNACGTTLSSIAVFSLQSSKLAPAGEGGILLTDSDAYFERAVCMGDIMRIIELDSPARRFAATSFGIKTRMAPLSAAVARVQLRRLDPRNARRQENLRYLSNGLEPLGFHTFLPPAHIERTYFEFLIRYAGGLADLSMDRLIEALRAEGCDVEAPRYPLVHQQPLFTEGHWAKIARLDARPDAAKRTYRPDALPRTEEAGRHLLKLPTFPSATRELLDQYLLAFRKVCAQVNARVS